MAEKEYVIAGQRITFPFKPYPGQFLLMSGIVKALNEVNIVALCSTKSANPVFVSGLKRASGVTHWNGKDVGIIMC